MSKLQEAGMWQTLVSATPRSGRFSRPLHGGKAHLRSWDSKIQHIGTPAKLMQNRKVRLVTVCDHGEILAALRCNFP